MLSILSLIACGDHDQAPNNDHLLIVSLTPVDRDGVSGQNNKLEYPVGIDSCQQFFTTVIDGVEEYETCKNNTTFFVTVRDNADRIEIFASDSQDIVITADEYHRLPRFLVGDQVIVTADLELWLR
jgi:hypothetical protein